MYGEGEYNIYQLKCSKNIHKRLKLFKTILYIKNEKEIYIELEEREIKIKGKSYE